MKYERYLDTKLVGTQRLLFESALEISESLGHSLRDPVSVSLLCLTLGIKNEEKEQLIIAFNKVLKKHEYNQLSIPLFKKVIEDTIPIEDIMLLETMTDFLVKAFMKAFARNYIPELEPFARSL